MNNTKYNQLIPDDVIDTLCDSIKKCIDNDEDYSPYIRIFDRLNNGNIPDVVKNIINPSNH
jgi:hypothetical protein